MQEKQNVEQQSDGYIFQKTQRSVDINYALLPMQMFFFLFFFYVRSVMFYLVFLECVCFRVNE